MVLTARLPKRRYSLHRVCFEHHVGHKHGNAPSAFISWVVPAVGTTNLRAFYNKPIHQMRNNPNIIVEVVTASGSKSPRDIKATIILTFSMGAEGLKVHFCVNVTFVFDSLSFHPGMLPVLNRRSLLRLH